ncbi:MAG: zinc-finger domain-containing protein [Pseudomonadota bacterium]
MMSKPLSSGNTQRSYEITTKEQPFCCPLPTNRLWDSHPRVYLPIAKTGHVICPYCETEYFLKEKVE